MSLNFEFDTYKHGCVSVNPRTGKFVVGEQVFFLNRSDRHIAATYLHLAQEDARASVRTMAQLCDAKDENNFRARLSQMRGRLKDLKIANGVDARALFLSDRLIGNQNDDFAEGVEKMPYHFNTPLVGLISQHGFAIPSQALKRVRVEHTKVIGPRRDEIEFRAGLGQVALVPAG